MMRNPLALLFILLWLIYGWFLRKGHCACCCTPAEAAAPKVMNNLTGPLVFNYDSDKAITGDGWEAYKKDLLSKVTADHNLEFTGWYRADEKNNSKFENLGLSRAHDARKLFPEVAENKVSYLAKLVGEAVPDKSKPFLSSEINARLVKENVKEIANKTLIYFPFNSTRKINTAEVESYLDDVAVRVVKSKEKVMLTGHTDNVGDDSKNQALGQARAEIVKAYLLKKGVPEAQLIANSKGESQPFTSNDTDEGRAKNRRTELEIIK